MIVEITLNQCSQSNIDWSSTNLLNSLPHSLSIEIPIYSSPFATACNTRGIPCKSL